VLVQQQAEVQPLVPLSVTVEVQPKVPKKPNGHLRSYR
jgi:hypothetical protein